MEKQALFPSSKSDESCHSSEQDGSSTKGITVNRNGFNNGYGPIEHGASMSELLRKRLHDQDDGDNKRRTFQDSDSAFTSDDYDISSIPQSLTKLNSHISNYSSESVYNFEKIPSSPPIYSTKDDSVNSSPNKKFNDIFTSQATLTKDDHEESDSDDTIDFNISNFNKIRGYISSDFLHDESMTNYGFLEEEEKVNEALRRIRNCFENGDSTINVEGLGLKTIPDEIEDLKNMVRMGRDGIEVPKVQIYAQHNQIRVLPPCLFDVSNISVLILRHNKLKKIPGRIRKLINLVDLSLVSNEIKSLPDDILSLPKLTNLLVRPNPYLFELDQWEKSEIRCLSNVSSDLNAKLKRYASNIKWSDSPIQTSSQLPKYDDSDHEMLSRVSSVPKLSELSLRVISRYNVTRSETKMWKKNVPVNIQKAIAKAIQKGAYEERCSSCHRITVNAIAKSLEWWDLHHQKLVPICRKFCCGNCVSIWLTQIDKEHREFKENFMDRANENDNYPNAAPHDDGTLHFDEDF